MNIEKLYTTSKLILNDFSEKGITSHFNTMVSQLQNTINQPQQPTHQQELSKSKTNLYEGLKASKSNKFNLIDISAAEEIGVYEYIGENLLEKINNVFSVNEITPSIALEELTKINAIVTKNIQALTKLTQGFNELNLEDLESIDNFNLVVRIPRKLINNNLSGFAESLESLNKNLLVFSEITTGSRESFEIDSLSTTDPTIALTVLWETGMLLLDVLAKVAAIYGAVCVLKQQRQNFIDSGAPEEKLTELTDWIGAQIKEKIDEEIPPLVDKYYTNGDKNRLNELKTEARHKALRIVENIDHGYTFDVKKPEEPSEEDPEVIEAVDEAIRQLNINSRLIEQTKIIGNNFLSLPANDDDLDNNDTTK